jgi:hypothetical protein
VNIGDLVERPDGYWGRVTAIDDDRCTVVSRIELQQTFKTIDLKLIAGVKEPHAIAVEEA